ncbi:YncE family protein [Pseudomonas viridiflava]|nr:YncE family protein [Pseudomonas viridiflava]
MHKKASQEIHALTQMADPSGIGIPLDIAWLTGIIPLGFVPREMVLSPDEKTLYVSNENGREISVIDVQTSSVVNCIKGAGAGNLTLSPDGKHLYTIGYNKCFVINTQTHEVIRVMGSGSVNRIVCSLDGRFIYLSFRYAPGGLIRQIETQHYSVVNDFDLGTLSNGSLALGVSPENDCVYASAPAEGSGTSAVSAIGTIDYLQHDIAGFTDPRSLAVSTDGTRLYVGGIDEVYIVDTTTLRMFYREKIGSQGYPVTVIGITPDDRYVYAVYTCNFDVYRIDTIKGTVTCVAFFPSLGSSVLNKAGTHLYSTHTDMNWVSIYKL